MPPTKLRWLIRFVNTDWNSSFNMTPKMLLVQELHFLKLILTLLLDCVLSWVNFTNFSSNKASFQFRYFSVVASLPSHVPRRWRWSLGLGMIGMPDLSQFSPLFVDCLFNREIVGRFAVQKSLSCSAIRLCVCFADFERIKYSIIFLFEGVFVLGHTISFT